MSNYVFVPYPCAGPQSRCLRECNKHRPHFYRTIPCRPTRDCTLVPERKSLTSTCHAIHKSNVQYNAEGWALKWTVAPNCVCCVATASATQLSNTCEHDAPVFATVVDAAVAKVPTASANQGPTLSSAGRKTSSVWTCQQCLQRAGTDVP